MPFNGVDEPANELGFADDRTPPVVDLRDRWHHGIVMVSDCLVIPDATANPQEAFTKMVAVGVRWVRLDAPSQGTDLAVRCSPGLKTLSLGSAAESMSMPNRAASAADSSPTMVGEDAEASTIP